MSVTTLKNFINGQPVAAQSGDTFELISPVDGQVNGVSPKSGATDVEAAYQAALAAFADWRKTTPSQRQKALLAIADGFEARAQELIDAQCRNTGQLKHFVASEEVAVCADQIRFFAGAARILEGRASAEYMSGLNSTIRREPLGVIAQVAPWNYPLMMAVWKVIPAIAAGNTVILKPSDTTPESTLLFAEIAAASLPPGVFNVILGDAATGEMLVSHPGVSMVSITGSVRAGKAVAAAAAPNLARAHLELGGNAPGLVFDDVAAIDAAAEHIVTTGCFNAGQDCTAATRVLVADSLHDRFLAALVEKAQAVRCGKPDDTDALYGALNNARQLAHVESFIANLGAHAKVETGGKRAGDSGFYFEPTIISGVKQDDAIVQNEVFGPVITVQRFSDEDDALAKANGVVYGLAASVWTSNHGRVQRLSAELNFGTVWINTHIPLTAEMPHGGFKQSGYGKDLSMYGFEEYTRIKHVMSSVG